MALVKLKEKHKIQFAEILLDLILQSEAVTSGEESKLLYINQEPTSVQVSSFLYDLQQPTKTIDQSEHSQILAVLPIQPELVAYIYAEQIIQAYENEQEFFQPNKVHNQEVVIQNEPQQEKMTKSERRTKKSEPKKWDPFFF